MADVDAFRCGSRLTATFPLRAGVGWICSLAVRRDADRCPFFAGRALTRGPRGTVSAGLALPLFALGVAYLLIWRTATGTSTCATRVRQGGSRGLLPDDVDPDTPPLAVAGDYMVPTRSVPLQAGCSPSCAAVRVLAAPAIAHRLAVALSQSPRGAVAVLSRLVGSGSAASVAPRCCGCSPPRRRHGCGRWPPAPLPCARPGGGALRSKTGDHLVYALQLGLVVRRDRGASSAGQSSESAQHAMKDSQVLLAAVACLIARSLGRMYTRRQHSRS